MQNIRLNHFLAKAGITSRRGADKLIEERSVKVNGKIVKKLGVKIDSLKDEVEYKSAHEVWKSIQVPKELSTYALYKPAGFVTSLKKQGSSPTIRTFLPPGERVFPVGRLDKDTEGLLLLTNDGDLAFKLMHPSQHTYKTYIAYCVAPKKYDENVLKSYLGRISKGIRLDGRKTMKSEIKLLGFNEKRHRVELKITLQEGRNRQIRRMLGRINLEVVRLTRVQIGKLHVDDLQLAKGKIVELTDDQIAQLFSKQ